ncbi:MAG: DUF1080 domain-containing protein, partial [Robiginitalea sp.]
MIRICSILLLGMLFVACGQKEPTPPHPPEPPPAPGISYPEYQGQEPTTPEQTEVYEPAPPVVAPKSRNGAPSDALV